MTEWTRWNKREIPLKQSNCRSRAVSLESCILRHSIAVQSTLHGQVQGPRTKLPSKQQADKLLRCTIEKKEKPQRNEGSCDGRRDTSYRDDVSPARPSRLGVKDDQIWTVR